MSMTKNMVKKFLDFLLPLLMNQFSRNPKKAMVLPEMVMERLTDVSQSIIDLKTPDREAERVQLLDQSLPGDGLDDKTRSSR